MKYTREWGHRRGCLCGSLCDSRKAPTARGAPARVNVVSPVARFIVITWLGSADLTFSKEFPEFLSWERKRGRDSICPLSLSLRWEATSTVSRSITTRSGRNSMLGAIVCAVLRTLWAAKCVWIEDLRSETEHWHDRTYRLPSTHACQ